MEVKTGSILEKIDSKLILYKEINTRFLKLD